MSQYTHSDVIIIGGSYAGLSAAMSLGRALCSVVVIDDGKPCNRQTPHAHNLITHDGSKPAAIAASAREQVAQYPTVSFHDGRAIAAQKTAAGFEIKTATGDLFTAKQLIFATGMKDEMPGIKGFADCWGISVIHCPYCHGYEVRDQPTAILANGDLAMDLVKLISNWTDKLTVLTNGPSTLNAEQMAKIRSRNIEVIESPVAEIQHQDGYITQIVFDDGSTLAVKAMYARPAMKQHCELPEAVGCALNELGHIVVDGMQQTNVPGVSACGDNTTMFRSLSVAMAAGTLTGAVVSRSFIEAAFA